MTFERAHTIDERLVAEVIRRVLEELARGDKTEAKPKDCGCGCGGSGGCPQKKSATSAPQEQPTPSATATVPTAGLSSVVAPIAAGVENSTAGDWFFTGQVLSVRDISQRPAGTRRIVVSPRTVVTPAARDELKDRKLSLERQTASSSNKALTTITSRGVVQANPTKVPCFSQAHYGKFDPQLMGLPLEVISADRFQGNDWSERVAPRVAQAGQAIVIALEPYVAVCELNRSPLIRAGYAPTTTALGKLVHQLRPNVIVVDARRFTHAMLKTVLEELASRPPQHCSVRATGEVS